MQRITLSPEQRIESSPKQRTASSPNGRLWAGRVGLAALLLAATAAALDLLVAAAAPSVLGVPSDLPALGLVPVLLASIPAVLGNAFGFYTSYRSHQPRALRKFLVPAATFFALFMIPPVWRLLAGEAPAAFAAAALLNFLPVAIAVPALLRLRPAGVAGASPSDV